jgi:hypothetical protein
MIDQKTFYLLLIFQYRWSSAFRQKPFDGSQRGFDLMGHRCGEIPAHVFQAAQLGDVADHGKAADPFLSGYPASGEQ